MRIMVDTNVLISALLFPGERMNAVMEHVLTNHRLVLSSYVVDELKAVVKRKFPTKVTSIETLLCRMSYEYVYTPVDLQENLFKIRDMKDYPVLYTAVQEAVDILITGDKDFENINIEKPEILKPAEYLKRFV